MIKPHTVSVSFDGVIITGTLTPEVPQIRYEIGGGGYPGDPPEFEITNIEGDGMKLVEFIEGIHGDIWAEIEEKCLEKLSES